MVKKTQKLTWKIIYPESYIQKSSGTWPGLLNWMAKHCFKISRHLCGALLPGDLLLIFIEFFRTSARCKNKFLKIANRTHLISIKWSNFFFILSLFTFRNFIARILWHFLVDNHDTVQRIFRLPHSELDKIKSRSKLVTVAVDDLSGNGCCGVCCAPDAIVTLEITEQKTNVVKNDVNYRWEQNGFGRSLSSNANTKTWTQSYE